MPAVRKVGNKDFLATLLLVLMAGLAALAAAVQILKNAPADDGTYVPREIEITPAMELLRDYVRIETTAGKERAGAEFLRDYLSRFGIDSEIIEPEPGRSSIYARLEGIEPDGGLLLLSHIDVKDADPANWTYPPFEGGIFMNFMWGRGTLDMKGIAICHLLAFVDAAKSGKPLKHDLVFLSTADEESGSRVGMEWLAVNRPDLFEGIDYAVTEGGITEMVREKIAYWAIESGSKQFVTARLRASTPEKIEEARSVLAREFDEASPDRIDPEVREYFEAIAEHRIEYGEALSDIDRAVEGGSFAALPATYRMLTQNNIYVWNPSADGDGASAEMAAALLPGEDPAKFVERLRALTTPLDVEIVVQWQSASGPVPFSSIRTEFFSEIERVIHETYGSTIDVGPYLNPRGGTDCRYVRRIGILCYGFLPYPVSFFQSQGIHGTDEHIQLDWFGQGVDATRELVRRHVSGG